jgi:hypothetical protein
MKTAGEVLLEIIHLKENPAEHEPVKMLELLADLARAVVELEHHRPGPAPAAEAQELAPAT